MLLSIIVPVYKIEEFYFLKCLDSLVALESDNVEIILVDDGSPDNCGVICDEYAEKDARIRVLHKENAGVSAARNDGLRMAQGKYLMFVDADDWVNAEKLNVVVKSLYEEQSEVVVFDYLEQKNGSTNLVEAFDVKCVADPEEKKEKLLKGLFTTNRLTGLTSVWAKVYKKSFVEDNSIFFNQKLMYGEDTIFAFTSLAKAETIKFDAVAFYYYRVRSSSVCNKKTRANFSEMDNLFQVFCLVVQDLYADGEFKRLLYWYYFENFVGRCSCRWDIGKSAIGTFIEKSKAIRREYKKEPFKTAVQQVRYSNYHFKGKVKVFLFKAHLPEIFLLMKWIQGKVKREKLY